MVRNETLSLWLLKNDKTDDLENCFQLRSLGVYMLAICVTGVISNFVLLWTLIRLKELRKTPTNRFIKVIAVNNLIGCIFDLPLQIISAFCCK
jgi:hypothetical protein